MIMNNKSKSYIYDDSVITILGMHRSGTSCLTGILQAGGLHLGEVVDYAPHNLKGNRENLSIRDLNDRVLNFNNAAWDQPSLVSEWSPEMSTEREKILTGFHESHALKWGFKDPRTTFTFPFWRDAVSLSFLGTFRHPVLVAASLSQRDGWSQDRGLELWFSYNRTMMDVWIENKFPVVRFDQPHDQYRHQVKLILDDLGLNVDGINFFEPDLVHQKTNTEDNTSLPLHIEALWREMITRYNGA